MVSKEKYYVVWKGRKRGIFTSWAECEAQVKGFPGAEYKAFESRAEAERALAANYAAYEGKPASWQRWLLAPQPPILPSLCVDAACTGSPGRLEYRGVKTESGEQVFYSSFAEGTNNVGEFLAIVQAMQWLSQRGLDWPIYSDSHNAIRWVEARKCATQLIRSPANAPLFEHIARAEEFLRRCKSFRVLKWDTEAWGENPADFGRK